MLLISHIQAVMCTSIPTMKYPSDSATTLQTCFLSALTETLQIQVCMMIRSDQTVNPGIVRVYYHV